MLYLNCLIKLKKKKLHFGINFIHLKLQDRDNTIYLIFYKCFSILKYYDDYHQNT